MLEKNKSKRPFVTDLFKYFPSYVTKMQTTTDSENFKVYA